MPYHPISEAQVGLSFDLRGLYYSGPNAAMARLIAVNGKSEVDLSMEMFAFHHRGQSEPYQQLFRSTSSSSDTQWYGVHSTTPYRTFQSASSAEGRETQLIELVAPLGPNSLVHRTLKKGSGTYHVCYQAPEINAAYALAQSYKP
jgi:hypothetical protein